MQDLQHKGVVTTTGQLPSEPMRASAHDVTPPFPLENCLSYKESSKPGASYELCYLATRPQEHHKIISYLVANYISISGKQQF